MARPKKQGFDYFPHDCHLTDRERFLLSKGGLEAYGLYIRLRQEIYSVGCCFRFGEIEQESFCFSNNVKHKDLCRMLEYLFDSRLFSREIYENYGFVTSKHIQETFRDMMLETRRTHAEIPDVVLLLDENTLPDSISLIESKVKESKVKETRRNHTETGKNPVIPVKTPNTSKSKTIFNIKTSITHEQYQEMLDRSDLADSDRLFLYNCAESMQDWSTGKGEKRIDWAATLRNWIKSERKKGIMPNGLKPNQRKTFKEMDDDWQEEQFRLFMEKHKDG